MGWLFGRGKKNDDMDVQSLLERARGRDGRRVATVEVAGVEAFRTVLEHASTGQNVGLLLAGVSRDDVQSGDVLSA